MDKSIFEFTNYKSYLADRVGSKYQRRGLKSAMAKALKCQPTYVSQVLNGHVEFSTEQAEVLSRFFGHTRDESIFFLLLVQKARAGTQSLKHLIQSQIDEAHARRQAHHMTIAERIGQKTAFTQVQQSIYYSSWHFAAIHVALTIPMLRKREALAEFFRIPLKKVDDVLRFLVEVGLAKTNGLEYSTGPVAIHLSNDAHDIIKHHTHWRQQALESLEREELSDLHYSTVVSLSREDVLRIKDRILEEIKANQAIVRESKEEEVFAYTIDFFSMKR